MLLHRPICVSALTVLVVVLSSPVGAETTQCTAITSLPYTISAPGAYCLTGDLTTAITSGNAITIAASSVTLDLNGHKLAGTGGAGTTATAIEAEGKRYIVIRNGVIRGFMSAALFIGSATTDYVIEDITADRNLYIAFWLEGSGIFRHNVISNTGGTTFYGANAPAVGILTQKGSSVIHDNVIMNVVGSGTGTGFGVRAVSPYSFVSGNRLGNMTIGIQFFESTGKYSNNLTSGVAAPFDGGTDAGGNN